MTGIASKELLVIVLLLSALRVQLARSAGASRIAFVGALLGFTALVQPSFILFAFVILAFDWLRGVSFRQLLIHALLLSVGFALVVTPWTLRNQRVFGAFVLITTNGGSNFYRANNPLATGGFTPRGEVDLSSYGEIASNRVGFQLGQRWVMENPVDFFLLSLRKQILFLGDDSSGVYQALRRRLSSSLVLYAVPKASCNAFWLAMWLAIGLGSYALIKNGTPIPFDATLLVLSVAYLYGLHSVFESTGKYHVPLTGVLAVLAGIVIYLGSRFPDARLDDFSKHQDGEEA